MWEEARRRINRSQHLLPAKQMEGGGRKTVGWDTQLSELAVT